MEYSINIHIVPVEKKGCKECFINKVPQVRVTVGERALIHPHEVLAQKLHSPLYTECWVDLGFTS